MKNATEVTTPDAEEAPPEVIAQPITIRKLERLETTNFNSHGAS